MNSKVRRELELPANIWEALDLVAEAIDQDPDELAAYCIREMLRCEADEDLLDLEEIARARELFVILQRRARARIV